MALLFSLTTLVSLVASNPVAPAKPIITSPARLRYRDASSADWIGYWWSDVSGVSGSSVLLSNSCGSGSTFTTSGSLADCCATDFSGWESVCSTDFKTSCDGLTVLSAGGSTTCDTSCNADTIFTSNTQDVNAILWYGCNYRPARFYYQAEPASADVVTSASSSITVDSSSSSTATPGTSSQSIVSQTSTPTPTAAPASKKENKAWIAGVVVGGLAIIAIAGLVFFLLRRRKSNKEQAYQAAPQMATPQMAAGYPQQPYAESYASPPPTHMSPNPSEHKPYYAHNLVPQGNQWGQDPNTNSMYGQYAPVPQAPIGAAASPASNSAAMPISELPELSEQPRR